MFILFWCFWPLYSLIRPYEFLTNLLMYVLFLNQKISNLSDCDYQRSNQHWCSLMRHETFAMFSIYIMWDASRRQRDHTLRTLPAIHLIASSCLLGWTTSTSSRPSWHPRMFNVCRILLPLSIAWTVSSSGLSVVIHLKLWHAVGGLYLWVFTDFPHVMQLNLPCLAGSTLLPLTMNGGLFEAISPTGGWYGFIMTDTSLLFHLPCCALELIYTFGSFTRSHIWLLLSAWPSYLSLWMLRPQ